MVFRPRAGQSSTKNGQNLSISEIKSEVEKLKLDGLSEVTLRAMDKDLEQEQEELERQAVVLHRELLDEVARGRASGIADHRKDIRRVARDHDELQEERGKVYDAMQRRILDDRLVQKLGAPWRAKALEAFVMVLIFLVLGLMVYEFVVPDIPQSTRTILSIVDMAACGVFLGEFFLRHSCADSKKWFWKNHWIDFVTSIPLPDLQALRAGRLARLARFARLARLTRVLRVIRVIFFFWRGMDKLSDVLDVKMMKRSMMMALGILIGGAILIHRVEGGGDGVNSLWESIWWSFTTVVTGGYGDIHNPTTTTGRVVTVLLVLSGMVVIGIFTATLTSVLVGDDGEKVELMNKGLRLQMEALSDKVGNLEGRMAGTPGASNGEEIADIRNKLDRIYEAVSSRTEAGHGSNGGVEKKRGSTGRIVRP